MDATYHDTHGSSFQSQTGIYEGMMKHSTGMTTRYVLKNYGNIVEFKRSKSDQKRTTLGPIPETTQVSFEKIILFYNLNIDLTLNRNWNESGTLYRRRKLLTHNR